MVGLLLVVHLDHHALDLDFVLLEVDIHTKYREMKFWYLLQYSAYKKKKIFVTFFYSVIYRCCRLRHYFLPANLSGQEIEFCVNKVKKQHSIAVHTDV